MFEGLKIKTERLSLNHETDLFHLIWEMCIGLSIKAPLNIPYQAKKLLSRELIHDVTVVE